LGEEEGRLSSSGMPRLALLPLILVLLPIQVMPVLTLGQV
jgi:hypothetical protein